MSDTVLSAEDRDDTSGRNTDRLLKLISRDIEMEFNAEKRNGFTRWALMLALMSVLALLWDRMFEVFLGKGLYRDALLYLLVAANLITFGVMVKGYWQLSRKFQGPIRLLSKSGENRLSSTVGVQWYFVISVLCIYMILMFMEVESCWLLIASGSWLLLRSILLTVSIRRRRKELDSFGTVNPDYTLLIPMHRRLRLLAILIFTIFEILNMTVVFVFVSHNKASFDTATVKVLFPIIVAFLLVAYIVWLLILSKVRDKTIDELKRLEFYIVKHGNNQPNMIPLYEEVYSGMSAPDWLELRAQMIKSRTLKYIQVFDNIAQSVKECQDLTKPNADIFAVAYFSLDDFKQFVENPLLTLLAETRWHLEKLKTADGLSRSDQRYLAFLQYSVASTEQEIKVRTDKIRALVNVMQDLGKDVYSTPGNASIKEAGGHD